MTPTDAPAESPPRPPRRRAWLWLLALPVAPVAALWWFTEPLTDHRDLATAAEARRGRRGAVGPRRRPGRLAGGPAGRRRGQEAPARLDDPVDRDAGEGRRLHGHPQEAGADERQAQARPRAPAAAAPDEGPQPPVRDLPEVPPASFPQGSRLRRGAPRQQGRSPTTATGPASSMPRLAVAPDLISSPWPTQRHPVTEAGLLHLARETPRTSASSTWATPHATTDRRPVTTDARRPPLRSARSTLHGVADGQPAVRQGRGPLRPRDPVPAPDQQLFDWPAPGHDRGARNSPSSVRLRRPQVLDAPLTAADFDPANPEYAFMRY